MASCTRNSPARLNASKPPFSRETIVSLGLLVLACFKEFYELAPAQTLARVPCTCLRLFLLFYGAGPECFSASHAGCVRTAQVGSGAARRRRSDRLNVS